MPVRSPLINVMIAAVQKAARKLTRDFGEIENLQVSKKGPADFVSTADKRSEKILHEELSKARPRFGFVMEEAGEIKGEDDSNRWIIDPLDGTTNFLHSLPHFAISVALERDSEPFAAVVYDPIKDEMFWAEKGAGAHLNSRRLRVSSREAMNESLFATGIPFLGLPHHDVFQEQMTAVSSQSSGVRRMGSAALDLAYVAAGRYEGYWENGLNYWDVAGGILLVREAGGFVTTMDGGRRFKMGAGIIASNERLRTTFSKIVTDATKKAKA